MIIFHVFDGIFNSVDTASQSSANLQCVTPMMTSIAKVVQPTATVSSVPVSGPSEYQAASMMNIYFSPM